MPDENGIVPTIFSVASSMIQNCFGYEPMMSVPLPADTRGFSPFDCAGDAASLEELAVETETTAARATTNDAKIAFMSTPRRYGNTRSIFRQSFCAAAHLAVQS